MISMARSCRRSSRYRAVYVHDLGAQNKNTYHEISYGVIGFYDYFDLKSFDMGRTGLLGFTKYNYSLNNYFGLGFAMSGFFSHSRPDNNIDHEFEGYNTLGGSVGISLEFDQRYIRKSHWYN